MPGDVRPPQLADELLEPTITTVRTSWAVAALALVVCGALAWRHPGLRLVDFLSFASRPDRIADGQDIVNDLYPVGYPAMVGISGAIVGSRLVGAKVLAVLAAALSAGAVARWLGPVVGLWLIAQPVWLTYGATEGTDLPSFALCTLALALARRRPAAAGAVLGLAFLTRYTAMAAIPGVLWLAGRRGWVRCLAGLVLGTTPHWLAAVWLGRSPVPDQSFNLAVGAGARMDIWGALAHWPQGLTRAVSPYLDQGAFLVGAAGLGFAGLRGDRRAIALLSFAALHLAMVSLAFANPRLLLPTLLTVALGLPLVLQHNRLARTGLAIAAGVWGVVAVGSAWVVDGQEAALHEVVGIVSTGGGPVLSTDPWVHRLAGDRLEPSIPARELGGDPRALDGTQLAQGARQRGIQQVVLDRARVGRTYPGLSDALRRPEHVEGLTVRAQTDRYVVFAVDPR